MFHGYFYHKAIKVNRLKNISSPQNHRAAVNHIIDNIVYEYESGDIIDDSTRHFLQFIDQSKIKNIEQHWQTWKKIIDHYGGLREYDYSLSFESLVSALSSLSHQMKIKNKSLSDNIEIQNILKEHISFLEKKRINTHHFKLDKNSSKFKQLEKKYRKAKKCLKIVEEVYHLSKNYGLVLDEVYHHTNKTFLEIKEIYHPKNDMWKKEQNYKLLFQSLMRNHVDHLIELIDEYGALYNPDAIDFIFKKSSDEKRSYLAEKIKSGDLSQEEAELFLSFGDSFLFNVISGNREDLLTSVQSLNLKKYLSDSIHPASCEPSVTPSPPPARRKKM